MRGEGREKVQVSTNRVLHFQLKWDAGTGGGGGDGLKAQFDLIQTEINKRRISQLLFFSFSGRWRQHGIVPWLQSVDAV